MLRYALILTNCLFFSGICLAKSAPVNPESVRVLEKDPSGCKFSGKISIDGSRLVPALKEGSIGRRAVKKAGREIDDAKEQAAKIGADTIVIPKDGTSADVISGTLKAYDCGIGAARKFDANSSEQNRSKKKFVTLLEILGLATPLNIGSGFTLGLHLSGNHVIELNAAFASADAGSANLFGDDEDSDFSYTMRKDGSSSIVGPRFKYFVNNSFYWHSGAALRQTKASLYAVEDYGDKESTEIARIENSDIGITFAIGNQWQWSGFTLGCDWIGLYVPVVKTKNSYQESNEDKISSSGSDSARKKFKNDMSALNIQGARLYLGAAF